MPIRRVLRGIVGTAVAWGLAWIPLTAGVWTALGLLGGRLPPMQYWGPVLLGAGIRGALSGAAFASVLAIAGRRRTFAELRLPGMMLWGAVGGLVTSAVSIGAALLGPVAIPPIALAFGLGVSSVLGACAGAGTLYVARRAPERAELGAESVSPTLTPGAA